MNYFLEFVEDMPTYVNQWRKINETIIEHLRQSRH